MTYNKALKKIWGLSRTAGAPTIERMRLLCRYLGDPQKKLKFIHVAGTNGKGSFAAMLDSILRESGYRTGRYISPYVIDFRERITINGEMISHDELSELCATVMTAAESMKGDIEKAKGGENVPYPIVKSILDGTVSSEPVQFEVVTAIALLYFCKHRCDAVVLECGLGGKYDATNVIDAPLVSVIMSIGFDHTELLGDKIEQIAEEKCGIIKCGTREVISAPQYPEAYSVIAAACADRGCRLTVPVKTDMSLARLSLGALEFTYRQMAYRTRMPAIYQMSNAATVIETVMALRRVGMVITDYALEVGLEKAWLPARFEVLGISPSYIIDGAHNAHGIMAFCDSMRAIAPQITGKVTFVLGMLRDKEPEKALMPFAHLISEGGFNVEKIITLTPNSPRAMTATELSETLKSILNDQFSILPVELNGESVFTSKRGIKLLMSQIGELGTDDALISFGSLYLAAELRTGIRAYIESKMNLGR